MFRTILTRRSFSTVSSHSKIAVIGAGCGGQTFIGQMARSGKVDASDITVFDPKKDHHYQPAYTMVAGGVLGDAKRSKTLEGEYIIKPN